MKRETIHSYREKYRAALFEDCIPFWMRNGFDRVNGGVYTCLDRKGLLYSPDKSVWFQGRCAWIFANLCNRYGIRPEWKEISLSCLDFLNDHCIDPVDQRMYFLVTADGKPLRKRRYLFSEAFFIIAAAEAGKAFGDGKLLAQARFYADFLMEIYRDPGKDPYKITPKFYVENRPTRSLAVPMILLNVMHVLESCDPAYCEKYEENAEALTADILRYHFNREHRILLETVGKDGTFLKDIPAGRLVNPGHALEACWFLLTQAQQTENLQTLQIVEEIFRQALKIGWDEEFGGVYAFTDLLGFPPEPLEHDMKLWWPTAEALISSILLYEETRERKYFDWFEKIDAYAFSKFADPAYGDWYGYLHRDGTPTLPACKGNIYKGPFHLPRMLMIVEDCLGRLESTTEV